VAVRVVEWRRRFSRLVRLPVTVVDVGLAFAFVVAVAVGRFREPVDGGAAADVLSGVLTLTMAGAVFARRRLPLAAYATGSAALVAEALLGLASSVSPYANLLGIFSLGLYATKSHARWAPPIALASVGLYFAGDVPTARIDAGGVFLVWMATWALGYTNARRQEEQELARRAARQQAIAEEQVRVSRELHDVIGHTVNLLVVQAGAARLLLDQDRERARELLAGMERTGRESLADLDHVLGQLRAGDPHPTPGLAQIPDLVDRLSDSRVDVTLTLDSGLRLPRNVDLSTYRIVQEALTNALKYAAPCSVTVDIHRDGSGVVVEVADDGPGLPEWHKPGRGLLGIAERVAMCGGDLQQGRGPRNGFMLRAVLPLP
jgi:signal transduction histidine kinase